MKGAKVTPYEWRKQTVLGGKVNIDQLVRMRDDLNKEIDERLAIVSALEKAELKRPYNKKTDDQPGPKKKHVAWQNKPGNEAKAAAWRKKMSSLNKGRRKA